MDYPATLALVIFAFLTGLITGDILAWRAAHRHARIEDQLKLLIDILAKSIQEKEGPK